MAITDELAKAFWSDGSDWYTGEHAATEQEIAAAEAAIGHDLPPSFRALLMQENGGVSTFIAYDDGENYFPLLPICGTEAIKQGVGAIDVRKVFNIPDDIVVFAAEGHAWWGLDYRGDRHQPAIVYRNDAESDIETVAPTFDEMLAGLVEDFEE